MFLCCVQVTIYHLLKLFQSETDIMLGKKSLVAEFYDELVSVCFLVLLLLYCQCRMSFPDTQLMEQMLEPGIIAGM